MKSKRHLKILSLIKNENISTQEELVARLHEEDIEVTQATISRDIKNLGLIKVPDGEGEYKYSLPSRRTQSDIEGWLQKMFQDFVTDMDYSENIIVIKTIKGTAGGVASTLDNYSWQNVLGTVAGDNTVMVVVKPPEKVEEVFNNFKKLLD